MKKGKEKDKKQTSEKKMILPIVISLLVLVIGGGTAFILMLSSPQRRIEAKLNQAEQYLSEQNYEQAVLAYQEIININADNKEAYLGIAEVYRVQASGATSVEEAMNCYTKAEESVENFQYTEDDLLVLIKVASSDIKNAYVVLDFMDELKEKAPETVLPVEGYIDLAVQYMDEVGGRSVYDKYSEKVYKMDAENLDAVYYGCVAEYMDSYGTKINPMEDLDVKYPMSEASGVMDRMNSTHCSVQYDIRTIADDEQKDARIRAFVYNENGYVSYASWVGNIVYQDDAYDVYYAYDEEGRLISIDAAGYTWGGGDNESLETRYTYRENGQLEKVMVNGSVYQEYRYDELNRPVYKYDNSFNEGAETWYTYHEAEGYIDSRTEYIPIDWDDDGVMTERLDYHGEFVRKTVLEDGTEINVIIDHPNQFYTMKVPYGNVDIELPNGNRLELSAPIDSTYTIESTEGEEASPNAIVPQLAGDNYVVSVYDTEGTLISVYTYIYDEYGLLKKCRVEDVVDMTIGGNSSEITEICYLTEVSEDSKHIKRVEMYVYGSSTGRVHWCFGETCEIIYLK